MTWIFLNGACRIDTHARLVKLIYVSLLGGTERAISKNLHHQITPGIGLIVIGLPFYEYFVRRAGRVVPPSWRHDEEDSG